MKKFVFSTQKEKWLFELINIGGKRKMLFGPDGKIVNKMTWKQFEDYQRWDEFPEKQDDPPMTTDYKSQILFLIPGMKRSVQLLWDAVGLRHICSKHI